MKHQKHLLSVMTAVLLYGPSLARTHAQQIPSAPAATPAPATLAKPGSPLTEEELRSRYEGKSFYLRGSYLGDELAFDQDGKVIGAPAVGSYTLSAIEIHKVSLSKKKLDIVGDRYGLHFRGALPFENNGQDYDRVKISSKPVHIAIDRELIVIPKAKKEKKKKAEEPSRLAVAPTATQPDASQAQSDMAMNKALDTIFASDLDARMMTLLPSYWQGYYQSKQKGTLLLPADAGVKLLADGMTPPRVLNRIDPESNDYAQQYGIAGMEMLRTVIDANGVPKDVAITRPIGFGLDEKAVEAVRHSRFQPAMEHGQAIPVVIDLVVTFRIYSNRTKAGSVASGALLADAAGDNSAVR